MTLQQRINVLVLLGNYIKENNEQWQAIKDKANRMNPWFISEFIELASKNIANEFLDEEKLNQLSRTYHIPDQQPSPKTIGIVMAGNLPMVGFHDLLIVFLSGHRQMIKLSSKDEVLMRHVVDKMIELNPEVQEYISIAQTIQGCDAYIATGSSNTGRYFDYYFGKFPNIIRKNRTSVAILTGNETPEELEKLADDIQLYFGLGCRNITKLYLPKNYDFEPLLKALNKYDWFGDFHKYKHNYDYHLSLLIMGNKYYMTNGTVILHENENLFTPISQVNFEYYSDKDQIINALKQNPDVQCIVAEGEVALGQAQKPSLSDFADGVDTMNFVLSL